MLVTRGDRALLGHSARFPIETMYATLAGFVEPGESLEEAVAREVLEETGVRVGRVTYHSSQPWPFPANIMLGFYAEALTEAITLDDDELSDARWFTRDQVRHPEAHGFCTPRRDSIASRLIEDWVEIGMKRMMWLVLLALSGCAGSLGGGASSDAALAQCQSRALDDPAVQTAIEHANSPLQEVRVPGVREQQFAMRQAVQRCMAAKGLAPKGGVEPVNPY